MYDSSGNQFPATGTFTLSSVRNLTVTPSPFDITGASTAAISAQMPPGLHLEARIGALRTLPMAEAAGTYSAAWDGRDGAGAFATAGTYAIVIWNADTQTRYDLQTSLQVRVVDAMPPDTAIVSGPAEGSYVSPAGIAFAWTGTDNFADPLAYAWQLNGGAWSAFDAATSRTFSGLADGPYTFSVKAKDQFGNEDATPAARNFTVDGTPPEPAANLTATPALTGVRLDWTHSPSADVHSYRLYWDGGAGAINYAAPFATIYHPANTFTAGVFKEGTYRYALRALDRAGNEEQNTGLVASATVSGFTVSVSVASGVHERGEDVPISGAVLSGSGTPLADVPVGIEVESEGYVRTYSAYTRSDGGFSYIFQPTAAEAGSYTVRARVLYQGLQKTASASFSIVGMLLEPARVTVDMSMNSPKTVNINVRNIGAAPLTGLRYTLADGDPSDPVRGFVNTAGLPTTLAAGASAVVPVLIIADPGAAPANPSVFTLNVAATGGAGETALITARMHDAAGLPAMSPDPFMAGVRIGNPVTKTATITNQGYAAMQDSVLTVHDPALYNWVAILDGSLGTIGPQEAKACRILVDPPAGTTLGTYVVQLDLKYNGIVKPFYMTVEVTTATVGQVEFKVHDDTGSVVPGAEVSFISKAFYVNVTPNGRQEYNNVIRMTTDPQGYALFSDVPAGDYRYVVNAVRHDQKDGLITVEPGGATQTIGVILVTNLVNVDFTVTPTAIQDQYTVNLNITYATDLIKPTLLSTPHSVGLSFFPEETHHGALNIENTSNNAPVRNLTLDATALDPSDNEIILIFDDGTASGTRKINLGELGPGKSVQVLYKAVIQAANPKLNDRSLGNIDASADYTFSIDGKAYDSTTKTPIPVLYRKPHDFNMPSIAYVNDEKDGNLCDLEYKGTTYRLSVKSNRNMGVTLGNALKAVNQVNGGPDAASILSENPAIWTGSFTPTSLGAKGDAATFDIDTLKAGLENRLCNDRANFLGKPSFVGFTGTWSDRSPNSDAYLIPISITTIRQQQIIVSDTGPCGNWVGGTIPTFNDHGTVKIQIDQKVTLEREAFNAKLGIKPSVTPLEGFRAKIDVRDESGGDASASFFVVVTQKSGIASLDGSSVSGPVEIVWQLIPNSSAGGTSAGGKNYSVSATIDYSFSGGAHTFTTQPETITVKPMPKLTIDYRLPYITMAGKPVKIKAIVKNNGYGPAHNLVLSSAQPKILENLKNIPISFTIVGSSATPSDGGLQNGVMDIRFGDIPAGGTAEGYWLLSTTKDGYFVEFTSALSHQSYLGLPLDPLIEATGTRLIPAIGGEIFIPPGTTEGMRVELHQGGVLKGQDRVNAYGNYLIPDLTAGDYEWTLKDAGGGTVATRTVTVVDGQPTARIDYGKPERYDLTFSDPKSPNATNLVVITHGWLPFYPLVTAEDWMKEMAKQICNHLESKLGSPSYRDDYGCSFNDWEVTSCFWEKSSATVSPNEAFVNAEGLGKTLGQKIKAYNYGYVHLIGHSAGAKLIEAAKDQIKGSGAGAKVLLTFLDAFDKNNNKAGFGKDADAAEHYVDTRMLGSVSTDFYLQYAFDFDVSDLDPNSRWWDSIRLIHDHGWPHDFYTQSIGSNYQFGFPLSKEGQNDPMNDAWTYPPKLHHGCCRPPTVDYAQCGVAPCASDGKILTNIHTLWINITDGITDGAKKIYQSLNGFIEQAKGKFSLSLKSGSPAWVQYEVTLPKKVNVLSFKYDFLSQAEGLLSVFLDDQIVYKSDERYAGADTVSTGNISLGAIPPGRHILTFRLDPFSALQSQVTISDVSFSLLDLVTKKEGDLNLDGIVDIRDAVLVMQVLADMTPAQPVNKEYDIDGDGRIGLSEVLYILQKVAGMR